MTDREQGGSSENRRKRLLFRAQRRGFKEVDLIFGAYAEAHLAGLDETSLDQFFQLGTHPGKGADLGKQGEQNRGAHIGKDNSRRALFW